jgi:membrane protein YdbS with pleckstrin-like domain
MLGDLSNANSVATYQVRLSQLGRWNILPIGVFCLLWLWESGKPMWSIIGIAIFFAFAAFATRWEHSIYKIRERELEILEKKLKGEE